MKPVGFALLCSGGVPVVVLDDTEVWMQSLSARRRVESRWNGDEGFRVRLELDCHPSEQRSPGTPVGCRRGAVRGGCGWVRAEFEHDDRAEEEAGGDVEEFGREEHVGEEYGEQDGGASRYIPRDGAPRDFEEG